MIHGCICFKILILTAWESYLKSITKMLMKLYNNLLQYVDTFEILMTKLLYLRIQVPLRTVTFVNN